MFRRAIIAACALLFLALVLAAFWAAFDWPPPRLILRYGFPPTGGPTGRTMEVEGVEFVELKPGYFRMGSHYLCRKGDLPGRFFAMLGLPWGTQPRHGNECPTCWIEIPGPLWVARTEVTNRQFAEFAVHSPWRDSLNWDSSAAGNMIDHKAVRLCEWLSSRSRLLVRIPTEEEWEFACRAGSMAEYCFGDSAEDLPRFSRAGPEPYGYYFGVFPPQTRLPNAWGLFDMHGNLFEIALRSPAYPPHPLDGGIPGLCPPVEWSCTLRGGSTAVGPGECRSASRVAFSFDFPLHSVGFRPIGVLTE